MTGTPAESGERSFDVAIVGAGPSGLAAAEVLRGYDLATVIIDEQPRAGGQILRQPPDTFRVGRWLPSPLYRQAKSVLRSIEDDPDIRWLFGATALGLLRDAQPRQPEAGSHHALWVQGEDGCAAINARVVLLAPGCYERPLAVPGWTLPGVMGAGAIQAFVKSQQFVPGKRFVLAGCHPLQLVVADQLAAAGADVAAVLFTQPLRAAAAIAGRPGVMLRSVRQLAATSGILRRLRRAAVPVRFATSLLRIEGGDTVERAVFAPVASNGQVDPGRSEGIGCDRVGLCYGFSVSSELARQAGAEVQYCPRNGGSVIAHDRWFESTVPGLFVAGEIAGMAGADAALNRGRIAACGILQTLQKLGTTEAARKARPVRRRLKRDQQFAALLNGLSQPPEGLADSVGTDDTIVCRCESVTRGELLRALAEHEHIRSANAVKLYTRAGMGMCQGRLCGDNVVQLVAKVRDMPAAGVGTFNARFPVKPLNLDRLGE